MYLEIIIIISFSILNRIRGSEFGRPFFNKMTTSLLKGTLIGLYYYHISLNLTNSLLIGFITFLGIWLWAAPGWGLYFSSFTGRKNPVEEEIVIIDLLADLFFRDQATKKEIRRWGTFAMSLRGLFLLPLFGFYGIYFSNSMWMVGLLSGFQGIIYGSMRFIPEKYAIGVAEYLIGIGMAIIILTAFLWI